MFIIDGKSVHDEQVVCSAFNNHFSSVFTKDIGYLPSFYMDLPSIPDIVISEHGICHLLLNIDEKKSPGPDGIPNAFLKRYAEWCAKYLEILFSKSLQEGMLPDD